jgi:hypothetical protein
MLLSMRFLLVTVIASAIAASSIWPGASLAQVSGNTFTSPTFGYTVEWQSPWFFLQESADPGFDYLALSAGTKTGQFFGGGQVGSAANELSGVIVAYSQQQGVTNYTPMTDDSGSLLRSDGETEAWAVYSLSLDLGSGPAVEAAVYLAVVQIENGLSVVVIVDGLMSDYNETDGYRDVISILSVNGIPLPLPGDASAATDTTADAATGTSASASGGTGGLRGSAAEQWRDDEPGR